MAHYDDPGFSYPKYWQGRDYEHQSEVLAIRRLLANKHVSICADIGGGYGRLTSVLAEHSGHVILVEPSVKLRRLAKSSLNSKSQFTVSAGTAQNTHLLNQSVDLAACIRVFHHLPSPETALSEFSRILRPGGLLLLEFANSGNFKSRLSNFFTSRNLSLNPIEKRSPKNILRGTIPFVNHHPVYITRQLINHGFKIIGTLSVSNFRSVTLKKIVPETLLLFLESIFQPLLSSVYFGPSIFILAVKIP